MNADKDAFYEKAAKGLAASTTLYGVDSIIHVEDKDDIWFWQQFLPKYRSGRYKFLPATTNERGNRTTGCTQCLKYKKFLSQKFFICIDSDLRYLQEEGCLQKMVSCKLILIHGKIIVLLLQSYSSLLRNALTIKSILTLYVFSITIPK